MKKEIPYRYRILVFLGLLTLITYVDRIAISLLGVRIKKEFLLSNEQFGWVLSAFALAYALFEIPSGAWGDKLGQRKVLIRIVTAWSLFTALTGAATGLVSLVVIRFLFGAGEAGAYPNASAIVSKWFPAHETSRGLSSLTVGANIGSALAPLIIVPVAVAFGWRVSFYVIGSIGLIWVAICYYWFRDFPSDKKEVSAEELAHIEATRNFEKTTHAISWNFALRHKNVWLLATAFFTSQCANYFFIGWMPIFLQEGRHFSENEMKGITSFVFGFTIVAAIVSGFVSDWFIKKKGLRIGRRTMGVFALGTISLLFFLVSVVDDKIIVGSCLIVGHLFLPLNIVTSFGTCVDIGGKSVGTVGGIMNCFGQMGAFLLSIFFGKLADATHSFNTPMMLIAGIMAVGSILWFFIDPTKRISSAYP